MPWPRCCGATNNNETHSRSSTRALSAPAQAPAASPACGRARATWPAMNPPSSATQAATCLPGLSHPAGLAGHISG